jgi:hypothetical protein
MRSVVRRRGRREDLRRDRERVVAAGTMPRPYSSSVDVSIAPRAALYFARISELERVQRSKLAAAPGRAPLGPGRTTWPSTRRLLGPCPEWPRPQTSSSIASSLGISWVGARATFGRALGQAESALWQKEVAAAGGRAATLTPINGRKRTGPAARRAYVPSTRTPVAQRATKGRSAAEADGRHDATTLVAVMVCCGYEGKCQPARR